MKDTANVLGSIEAGYEAEDKDDGKQGTDDNLTSPNQYLEPYEEAKNAIN